MSRPLTIALCTLSHRIDEMQKMCDDINDSRLGSGLGFELAASANKLGLKNMTYEKYNKMTKINEKYKTALLNPLQRSILNELCERKFGVSYFSLKMNDREHLILPALLTLSRDEDVKNIIGYLLKENELYIASRLHEKYKKLLQENEYDITSRLLKKYKGIFNESRGLGKSDVY